MSNNLNGFSNSRTPLGSFRMSLLTWNTISVKTPQSFIYDEPLGSYRVLLHCVLHVNVGARESLDQDVTTIVHLQFASFPNLFFKLLRLVVTQRVVKSIHSNSKSIKTFFWTIHRQDRGTGIGLGDPSVPLEHDNFGPYLVINAVPLGQDLNDMILREIFKLEDGDENRTKSSGRRKPRDALEDDSSIDDLNV